MCQLRRMISACLIHFNFDMVTVVHWIGGQHTAAHRDVTTIITKLRHANIDASLTNDLEQCLPLALPEIVKHTLAMTTSTHTLSMATTVQSAMKSNRL
jgi:hypothetical protein